MSAKISVIVPIYNVAPYLRRCVDSILQQTYSYLEIFLIDDGSTDESGDICDNYAAKDSRVRVFHVVNGGVSAARNIGLANMTGEYVSFVDADDWIAPTFLDKLFFSIDNADICVCHYCDVKGESVKQVRAFSNPTPVRFDESHFGRLYPHVVSGALFNGSELWNKLFFVSLIRSANASFALEKGENGEDLLLVHTLLLHGAEVRFCDDFLYFHLYVENSLSKNKNKNLIGPFVKIVAQLDSVAVERGLEAQAMPGLDQLFLALIMQACMDRLASDGTAKDVIGLLQFAIETYPNGYRIQRLLQHAGINRKKKLLCWLLLLRQYRLCYGLIKLQYQKVSTHLKRSSI